jgi:outer membrane receptor for Fe3+-dicitrate
MFNNPELVYHQFRPCVLGYDTSCGGIGNIRGMPTWNVDVTVLKDIGIWKEGRVGATLSFQISNVLNHAQLGSASPSATTPNPTLGPSSASNNINLSVPKQFGIITAQANTPRNMEFGLRIHF